MSVADNGHFSDGDFVIEDMWFGGFSANVLASGFGRAGSGRSFSFSVEGKSLVVEVYRPRLRGPVPQPEDVIATIRRSVVGVDITDARSLGAAVRDAVTLADAST